VLCARSIDRLAEVCAEIKALATELKYAGKTYEPQYCYLDLADPGSILKAADDIVKLCDGKIDILVNNAGLSFRGRAADTLMEVHRQVMEVNYFGHLHITSVLLPILKQQPGGGFIIAVGSVQSKLAIPFRGPYGASKHAFASFFDSLRAESAANNVHVLVIYPSYIATRLSLNSVTAAGDPYGKLDTTTEFGFKPSVIAVETVEALESLETEVIFADYATKLAVLLRNWLPNLYFSLMERRALKEA